MKNLTTYHREENGVFFYNIGEYDIQEQQGKGMAGEPMTFITVCHKGKPVDADYVAEHQGRGAAEVLSLIQDIDDENYNSAVSFVI